MMYCSSCNNEPCVCGENYKNLPEDLLRMLVNNLQQILIEKICERKIKSAAEEK